MSHSHGWQFNQRRMVRGNQAWVRFNSCVIPFVRMDVRIPGFMEGLDGWGNVTEIGAQSQSVWVDPIGRRFQNLDDAFQQVMRDRQFN